VKKGEKGPNQEGFFGVQGGVVPIKEDAEGQKRESGALFFTAQPTKVIARAESELIGRSLQKRT